jgi:hypothetical protein
MRSHRMDTASGTSTTGYSSSTASAQSSCFYTLTYQICFDMLQLKKDGNMPNWFHTAEDYVLLIGFLLFSINKQVLPEIKKMFKGWK